MEDVVDSKHDAIKLRNSQLTLSDSLLLSVSFFSFISHGRFPKTQLSAASHGEMHYLEALDLSFDAIKHKFRGRLYVGSICKVAPGSHLSQDLHKTITGFYRDRCYRQNLIIQEPKPFK